MSNTKKTAMAVKIQFSSDKYKLSELKYLRDMLVYETLSKAASLLGLQ